MSINMFAVFGLGTTELLIVAGVALLLFGTRLPSVARSLGQGIVEFKKGLNSGMEDDGAEGGEKRRLDNETTSKP